jgi:type I restriction enzyme, S subunit
LLVADSGSFLYLHPLSILTKILNHFIQFFMNHNDSVLADLPLGWKWVKLGEICDKISLNNIKIKQKDYKEKGKFPVVDQGQDLIGGYFDDENLLIPNEPPYIVFGDHTKVKKYINFKFIAGADGVKVLKSKEIANPKFLFYSLFTIKIEDKGYARHFQLLEKELFPLPPLSVQEKIVEKIETLLSELDRGKAQLLTAQAQLKTYRQAVLKYAFEGKLTGYTEGWDWVKLGEVFKGTPQNGIYKPSTEYGQGFRIMRIDGFYDGVILPDYAYKRLNLNEDEINRYSLEIGDLLINRVNSLPYLGKCGLVNKIIETTVFESNIMRIKLNNVKVVPKFVSTYLTSKMGLTELRKNAKHAVNQASINQTDVSNVQFPLPPLSIQAKIVSEIESRLSVCDKLEETIKTSLLQSESLRQSVLKRAFEGKLV